MKTLNRNIGKRLKLAVFKAKNINQKELQKVDQLLGQVLGDCHDNHGNKNGIPKPEKGEDGDGN